MPVTATGVAQGPGNAAVPPPGGGWTFNGSAQMSGAEVILTPAKLSQSGSVIFSVPAPSDGLTAKFTTSIGGGTGGDGMTLALLDSGSAGLTALGSDGAGLGWAGQSGVAVALVTNPTGSEPSSPFVGIATGSSGGQPTSTTNVPDLRTGTQSGTVSASDHRRHRRQRSSRSRRPAAAGAITASPDLSGPDNLLTPAAPSDAGSVVFPTPVATSGLNVQFNLQISGGNNGYGVTFALLDPASSTATSIGADGALLGFGALTGVATMMVTKLVSGYPSSNFVGTATQSDGTILVVQRPPNRNIEQLNVGTHTFRVHITSDDVLEVWMDGALVLQQSEPTLTSTALLAFTAATGADGIENHVVRDIAITAQNP